MCSSRAIRTPQKSQDRVAILPFMRIDAIARRMTDDKLDLGDLQPKPMKGKYDKRKNNGATKVRRRKFSNMGRKTLVAKGLSRNDAARTLEELVEIASPADIFRAAWEKGNVALCAEMYKQFQDRLLGRPFIAENPQTTGPQSVDPRVQRAVRALNIVQPQKEPVM
jgi:hypothetical protein